MGWAFEHLGWELRDTIIDRLKRYKGYKNQKHRLHLQFDEQTTHLTEYGNGFPNTGEFKGSVVVCNDKDIELFEFEYTIRRTRPANGYDYEEYEEEYECRLRKFKKVKSKNCEACKGEGYIKGEYCKICNARGIVAVNKKERKNGPNKK